MRCKTCDYPLWSIRSRQCPECGAPFKPADFDFTPNAVQFQCPHCAQAYYGTDARGHLVPRSFACVSCGEPVSMDEMVLLPTEGVEERRTTATVLPWLDPRKKRSGAWLTIGLAMAQPRRMMDITPVASSVGRAWWFYTIVMALVLVLSGFGMVVVAIGGGVQVLAAMAAGLAMLLAGIFGWLGLWGLVSHGLMRALGARPRHTIGRTYQALCYSSAVMLPSAIPCVGFYLLPLTSIWWMVAASAAVVRAQGARAGRGVIAVVLLPVLLYAGTAGLIVWSIVRSLSFQASMVNLSHNSQQIDFALAAYSAANGGAMPDHGARLLSQNRLNWNELTDPLVIAQPAQSIGGLSISQWTSLSSAQRERVADAMAAALPADWAAHRLGNVVFTYNGVSQPAPQDPGLWVFLFWPDAQAEATFGRPQRVGVQRADGRFDRIDLADFPRELAAQNALRVQHGLAPIPDPSTVMEVTVDPSVLGGP